MSRLGYSDIDNMLFSIEYMYNFINDYAQNKGMTQTLEALKLAQEKHQGQLRKCKCDNAETYPYFHHPLRVAMHAITLGFDSDDIVATALLHDVCEDCGVSPQELPMSSEVKSAVGVLTKSDDIHQSDPDFSKYFKGISENKISVIVKLLDRCSNVTDMASGFSDNRIRKYIRETETLIYPLFDRAHEYYPDRECALFNLEYHMRGIVETVKAL